MSDMRKAVYFEAMSPIYNLGVMASSNRRTVDSRLNQDLNRNVFGRSRLCRPR
jgi:hypothetical protein